MLRILARGKTGLIVIRDRKPDGSWVLLACEEFEPSGGGGVIGDPDDDEIFPMLNLLARNVDEHARRSDSEPFRLEVDVTDMPSGELRFRSREFTEQAAERWRDESVSITPDSAAAWGYGGSATAGT